MFSIPLQDRRTSHVRKVEGKVVIVTGGVASTGTRPNAAVVNTSSGSGIYGNQGQSNYGAAEAKTE